jgi:hypothetical protein
MKPTLPLLALAAASLTLIRPAAAAVDQGLLALVPESTVLLTGIDAESTRSSEFGQYFLNRIDTEDPNFQKFTSETGFDPRRDLQTVLIAGFGPHQTQDRTKFAILARGMFDPNRIAAGLKAKGSFVRQSYGGTTLFVNSQKGDSAFTFPDTGLAVMGDLATVKEIIDHRANPTTLDPGLLDRATKAGAANDVWFASLLSGSFFGNHIELPGAGSQLKDSSALQSILQSSGGLRFGHQVKLSLDATTRSPQDATSLTDVVRFMSSLVQMQRRNDPNAAIIASALDRMELQTNGADLHLGLSLSEQNLELLAQSGSKRGR